MKNIEIDEELYQYIATNTQYIGESASSILRRLLNLPNATPNVASNVSGNESTEPEHYSSTDNSSINTAVLTSETNALKTEHEAIDVNVDDITTKAPTDDELSKQAEVKASVTGSVFDYINKEDMAMQRGAVGRFLLILAALYRVHGEKFSVVYEIRGRDRLYFADSEAALEQSGSSTKPRQIPESPYWVITNSNTTRKKMMLTEATKALGYSESEVEEIRDLL